MAEVIVMPRQGQSVETCIITQWLKQKGEHVEEGEILFSYETDKAAFDEVATHSGTLLEILVNEGDEVPVLDMVAIIGKKGEDISSLLKKTDSKAASESVSVDDKNDSSAQKEYNSETIYKPRASDKIRISPRARRMAMEKGLDLEGVIGSGPNGRIIAADITDLKTDSRKDVKKNHNEPVIDGAYYTDHPLSNIRKLIATNMMRSLGNSAQLTHHTSADARAILRLRKAIKEGQNNSLPASTTLNDMLCFAIIQALRTTPEMNAHFLENATRQFKGIHLGIAVDTPRGLMVPVLKNADRFTLGGLAESLSELASSCKNGSIDPDLLSAAEGSFTISNLGAFGVELFTPVLNLPQVGIMGINTITLRPADLGDGTIGFVPHIGLSLTYDHRAIDGAPASRFLQEVAKNIAHFDSYGEC